MLSPTNQWFSLRKSHHSSLRSVPLVWRSLWTTCPGLAYLLSSSTTLLKKSSPRRVGSPPCQENTTSFPVTPSMYCWMNRSRTSSDIRPMPGPSWKCLLAQVIAILAIQVASGTTWFGHDVESSLACSRTIDRYVWVRGGSPPIARCPWIGPMDIHLPCPLRSALLAVLSNPNLVS